MASLYVHVPFCLQKCYYCAFYSLALIDNGSMQDCISSYLLGIEREIEYRHTEAPAGVSSIFVGGGTPTALEPQQLSRLLKLIQNRFGVGSQDQQGSVYIEKTVESNPGTITVEKLAVLRDYGVNRISLGAQSFDDNLLRTIGRIHTAQDSRDGVKLIREAKFTNLNLDLMFGLPGQTMEDWRDTVQEAVGLCAEHISIYGLTLEEETPLGRLYEEYSLSKAVPGRYNLPDDDLQADMYEWAVSFLGSQGYIHYEIANFALQGFQCRHNLSYWHGEDYIGLGPGAVSCTNGVRFKNTQDIDYYADTLISGRPLESCEVEYLTPEQRISETIMLGLRTTQGIDIKAFQEKFKMDIQDIYGYKLVNYMDRKIILVDDGRLTVNPTYLFVINSILRDLIL